MTSLLFVLTCFVVVVVSSLMQPECKQIIHSPPGRSCHAEAMSKGSSSTPQKIPDGGNRSTPRSGSHGSGSGHFAVSPQPTAQSPGSAAAAQLKKQRGDFKFGKILGEGSYSEVSYSFPNLISCFSFETLYHIQA